MKNETNRKPLRHTEKPRGPRYGGPQQEEQGKDGKKPLRGSLSEVPTALHKEGYTHKNYAQHFVKNL